MENMNAFREGDIVAINGRSARNALKRVVYCERLNTLAFQNPGEKEMDFDENVRGNKMLSTFTFLPHYEVEVVGFQEVKD